MKKFTLLIIIGLFFLSCDSEDISNSKKLITESIDINADSKPDFKLEYYELSTTDIPSSSGAKIGKIIPIDENLILYNENNGYLFLEKGDIITKNGTDNKNWYRFEADVISKKRTYEVWDKIWTVESNLTENYYLGIKLKSGSSEKIGWIKLEFDTANGKVYILDSEISSLDELTIKD